MWLIQQDITESVSVRHIHIMATCILMRANDVRSSQQMCQRWRRRRACTSCRSRLPSSPHRQHSGSRCARTPEGRQSPPAGTERRFSSGLSPSLFYHHKKKQNHTLSLSQTWQESTPPFMLPAQNMLSSSESPYTWGALHFSWEIRTTRASSSWLVPYFSETGRETVKL